MKPSPDVRRAVLIARALESERVVFTPKLRRAIRPLLSQRGLDLLDALTALSLIERTRR